MSLRDRLDRLDARFARSGPLALLRDVPQLAMLLVAVVFFAGTGVVLARSGDDDPERGGGVARPALADPAAAGLGPVVGERVDAYFADARTGLVRAARTAPGVGTVSLVTLRAPLTPQQAVTLTAGLQVNRVYLRAASARRPETVPVEVRDLRPDLAAAYARLATRKGTEITMARALASSIGRDQPDFRAAAFDDLAVVTAERAAYRTRCACVMALVVTGIPTLLGELARQPSVAAVEVSRTASLDGLAITPVAPEQTRTGVVTELPPNPQLGG